MVEGATMLQAMPVPAGTSATDVRVYAESYSRIHNYTLASSLTEVRAAAKGDKYWLDTATDTLYWRVITGLVSVRYSSLSSRQAPLATISHYIGG
jgi:hypothetical protein